MLPPSGQASGSRRCWKTQSWGPGIQSFEVVNMNFGYFGQHTSCMKKHYWLFLLPPSGQASCSRRCWKRQSKGTGIQRFEAVNMNIGYIGQHTSSMKKHYGYFLIPPSEQGSGSGRCWKMQSWGPVVVIPPLPGKAGEPGLYYIRQNVYYLLICNVMSNKQMGGCSPKLAWSPNHQLSYLRVKI